MKFTKQMNEALLGETFHTIDWKYNKGMRQSEWQRYRIVHVRRCEDEYYTIQEVGLESVITFIPRWLGGRGWFNNYSEMFWEEWDGDVKVFTTYQEARDVVQSAIDWVRDIEGSIAQTKFPKVEKIVSCHPEEGEENEQI